jgi:hypothetical protein
VDGRVKPGGDEKGSPAAPISRQPRALLELTVTMIRCELACG